MAQVPECVAVSEQTETDLQRRKAGASKPLDELRSSPFRPTGGGAANANSARVVLQRPLGFPPRRGPMPWPYTCSAYPVTQCFRKSCRCQGFVAVGRSHRFAALALCLHFFVESPAGPFGRSPFQLFTIDRRDLQPLDGTLFWSQWSEMSLLPYTIYFEPQRRASDTLTSLKNKPLDSASPATSVLPVGCRECGTQQHAQAPQA